MTYAYYGCTGLPNSAPVCGPNVIDMSYAYAQSAGYYWTELACGNKVQNMASAYYNIRTHA